MQVLDQPEQEERGKFLAKAGLTGSELRAHAGMGQFVAVSSISDLQKGPVLVTTGAYTCPIAAVRLVNGCGALGHIDAGNFSLRKAKELITAVQKMVSKMDGVAIEDIVFAAGVIGDGKNYAHPSYILFRQEVADRVGLSPDKVRWVLPHVPGEWYEAAVLLPNDDVLLLFGNEEDWTGLRYPEKGPYGPYKY